MTLDDLIGEVGRLLILAGYSPVIVAIVLVLIAAARVGLRSVHYTPPAMPPDLIENPPSPPVPTANPRVPPDPLP